MYSCRNIIGAPFPNFGGLTSVLKKESSVTVGRHLFARWRNTDTEVTTIE